MGQHEDKIAILRKYYKDIPAGAFDFYIAGDIKSKKIDNAISSFAQGVDRSTIIGFYDLTVMGSGKNGYLPIQSFIIVNLWKNPVRSGMRI